MERHMKPVQLDHQEIARAVQEEFDNSPYRDYLNNVINRLLAGRTLYLCGGAVRDPIVKSLYGRNGYVRDFDILVDDSEQPINLGAVFKGEKDASRNRFGTIKIRLAKDFEIDICPFSNATILRNRGKGKYPNSLDTWLLSCDFNTGAIAYCLGNGTIHEYRALDAIARQEVDLLDHAGDEPHIMMARLVLHSDKLGFRIGPKGKRLISEGYNPGLDDSIAQYLDYKGLGRKQNKVIQELWEISRK